MNISKKSNADKDCLNIYEDFFIQNYESLCSFIYSYIPDIEIAKDIVQDTFISLWQNRDKYHLTNSLLYTIAKNKSIDYLKANHQTKILTILSKWIEESEENKQEFLTMYRIWNSCEFNKFRDNLDIDKELKIFRDKVYHQFSKI